MLRDIPGKTAETKGNQSCIGMQLVGVPCLKENDPLCPLRKSKTHMGDFEKHDLSNLSLIL